MFTLDEIQKLTLLGQSVKKLMSDVERAVRDAATSGEMSVTFPFIRGEAWRTCSKLLEDKGFEVTDASADNGTMCNATIAWGPKQPGNAITGDTHVIAAPKLTVPKDATKKAEIMVPSAVAHVWRKRPRHLPRFDGNGKAYCNYHQSYHRISEFTADTAKDGEISTTCTAGQIEVATKRISITMVPKIAKNGDVYCIRCSKYHPASEFTKNKAKKSGYSDYCRACEKSDRLYHLNAAASRATA